MDKVTSKTQEEILNRARKAYKECALKFQFEDLFGYLEFENAIEFMKPEYVAQPNAKEQWDKDRSPTDPEQRLREYMSFAWDKAHNERGISAYRSIEHMKAWLFLMGDDEAVEMLDSGLYGPYGKTALKYICNRYDIEHEQY